MSERDHDCMDWRQRVVANEGDDVVVELCAVCGKVRMESDGGRPMAWFLDPTIEYGFRYAYRDPRNTMDGPEVWADVAGVRAEP